MKKTIVLTAVLLAGSLVAAWAQTVAKGDNFADKMAWLDTFAKSGGSYIIEVTANESIAANWLRTKGLTIILRGVGANRTLSPKFSEGTMFSVYEGVMLVLDNNITLSGMGKDIILVELLGGNLIMNNGSSITGTKRGKYSSGGGVSMPGGNFIMNGGTIYGNTAGNGGGVNIRQNGTFTMNGGTISGNTAEKGGGVNVDGGIFRMDGGTISGNTANNGGGVFMPGDGGTFTMNYGTISGNTAREEGGGVSVWGPNSKFNKTGGTITGYGSDKSNGNVIKDVNGTVRNFKGHAAFAYGKIREATAGPGDNLSYNGIYKGLADWDKVFSGVWDNADTSAAPVPPPQQQNQVATPSSFFGKWRNSNGMHYTFSNDKIIAGANDGTGFTIQITNWEQLVDNPNAFRITGIITEMVGAWSIGKQGDPYIKIWYINKDRNRIDIDGDFSFVKQ